jgi:hypothetical protein
MGDKLELRFITDEDVPRSTARVLRDAGFDTVDVRDVGLREKVTRKFSNMLSVKIDFSLPATWVFQTS